MNEIILEKSDVVYIAGPMSGKPLYNYPAFYSLAGLVEKIFGCKVLNPARQPDGLTYEEYMQRALRDVNEATAVIMLNGWSESRGACQEWNRASDLRLKIYYEPEIIARMELELRTANPSISDGSKK